MADDEKKDTQQTKENNSLNTPQTLSSNPKVEINPEQKSEKDKTETPNNNKKKNKGKYNKNKHFINFAYIGIIIVLALIATIIALIVHNPNTLVDNRVTVHFETRQGKFYNKDIDIEKGTSLGEKILKPKHPLFVFDCWKFPNGDILTPDTPINSDTTVYADYKMDSQYKTLCIQHQKEGWIDIENVYSDEDTLKVTTISGETRYANDIINLIGIKFKDDKAISYSGFRGNDKDGIDIRKFRKHLDNAILDKDYYYKVILDEFNCWLPKSERYYYVCHNGCISDFPFYLGRTHNDYDKYEHNPNHDRTLPKHPFCDFDGFYFDNGTQLIENSTPITKDCTVRAKWKFAYSAMKVRLKENVIFEKPDDSNHKDCSDSQGNEVVIVDVHQDNNKKEWGKLESGEGWIPLEKVTTILAVKRKPGGSWEEKKNYLIRFELGKENGLGDRIVAVPHGETIQVGFYYGDLDGEKDPVRFGYKFYGWTYQNKPIDKTTKIEHEYDEPIKAMWIPE